MTLRELILSPYTEKHDSTTIAVGKRNLRDIVRIRADVVRRRMTVVTIVKNRDARENLLNQSKINARDAINREQLGCIGNLSYSNRDVYECRSEVI